MFTLYHALAWGFILPVLALCMLAADVATGTTPFHHIDHEDK